MEVDALLRDCSKMQKELISSDKKSKKNSDGKSEELATESESNSMKAEDLQDSTGYDKTKFLRE